MEQYTPSDQDIPAPIKPAPESKEIHSLISKVSTLENFVHDQSQEILKLKREISRLKSSIDQIVSVIKNRG